MRKERMKDRPNYFNKVIQGRTKMLLSCPPLSSNTPLDDTTMPSNDSSKTNPKIHEKKSVGCKRVFSVKYKLDRTIDRYKARLPLRRFDVKNVFFHCDLLEEVYMDPSLGFTPKGGKVCKLNKKGFIWIEGVTKGMV
ncbi:hypothetical protein AAG906_006313 [Vitis piasezkii]